MPGQAPRLSLSAPFGLRGYWFRVIPGQAPCFTLYCAPQALEYRLHAVPGQAPRLSLSACLSHSAGPVVWGGMMKSRSMNASVILTLPARGGCRGLGLDRSSLQTLFSLLVRRKPSPPIAWNMLYPQFKHGPFTPSLSPGNGMASSLTAPVCLPGWLV